MKTLPLFLGILFLSTYSHSLEVVKGPFLIRDGLKYRQDTNELVTGIIEEFFYDGTLAGRQTYKDGKRDGLSEDFSLGGGLEYRRNYVGGELRGIEEGFHDNGQLKYRRIWGTTGAVGLAEQFHDNGQLECRANFKDGEREGLWEEFYVDGKLRVSGRFRNGKRDGLWKGYFVYDDHLISTGSYHDGKKDGLWEEFDPHIVGIPLWGKDVWANGELVSSWKNTSYKSHLKSASSDASSGYWIWDGLTRCDVFGSVGR